MNLKAFPNIFNELFEYYLKLPMKTFLNKADNLF